MTAWKDHERETARYFGTRRRLRGSDFSQSDVEVLVDVETWLNRKSDRKIVVECKYSKQHGIVTHFKDTFSATNGAGIPIMVLDNYYIVRLDDFQEFYEFFLDPDIRSPKKSKIDVLGYFDTVKSKRKAPKYLDEYREQAKGYISPNVDTWKYLAISCIAKSRTIGKLICIHKEDIQEYRI